MSVNTVRSAYARLENEGLVRTEHGRGTFVADERGTRRELRRQIERLEAAVARGPQRGTAASGAPAGRLLTTDELRAVRDSLRAEVARLDAERGELMRRLEELDRLEREPATGRRSRRRRRGALVIDQLGQGPPALGRRLATPRRHSGPPATIPAWVNRSSACCAASCTASRTTLT